jgi:hypothetical protein
MIADPRPEYIKSQRTELSSDGEFVYVAGNVIDDNKDIDTTGWNPAYPTGAASSGTSKNQGFFSVYKRDGTLVQIGLFGLSAASSTFSDMAVDKSSGIDVVYLVGTTLSTASLSKSDVLIAKYTVTTTGTFTRNWNQIPVNSTSEYADSVSVSGGTLFIGGRWASSSSAQQDIFVATFSTTTLVYTKFKNIFTSPTHSTSINTGESEGIDKMAVSASTGQLYILARTMGNNFNVTLATSSPPATDTFSPNTNYDWFIMCLDSTTLAEKWAKRPLPSLQTLGDDYAAGVSVSTIGGVEKVTIVGNSGAKATTLTEMVDGISRVFLARYDHIGTLEYLRTDLPRPSISGSTVLCSLGTGVSVVGTTAYISGTPFQPTNPITYNNTTKPQAMPS